MARKRKWSNVRGRRKKPSRAWLWGLALLVAAGVAAWLFWPKKSDADSPEQDATGGGPGTEGVVVKNDAWTLRTYPHSASGTQLKIADNAQTQAFNGSARVRKDFRTTDGASLVKIGETVGVATGDSVKWRGTRFIRLSPTAWVAANLVTTV